MMNLFPLDRLPILPDQLLRSHKALSRFDTRFRAAARLRQSLWREAQDLAMGSYTTASGAVRKIGNRLTADGAERGGNFITPAVHRLVRRDYSYREPGAAIDEERLFANLLSSMPLAFNLAGPLKLNGTQADRFVKAVAPEVAGRVSAIWFEHSPGRGDPNFLDDGSAFDIFIAMRRPDGAKTFLAMEIKYSENMAEAAARHRPRYDQLSKSSGLFLDPTAPALRRSPLQQLWREHMLAQALLDTGLYDAGAFILIAPKLNTEVQRAASHYQAHLTDTPGTATFLNLTLEDAVTHLRTAGAKAEAHLLHDRYLDFTPVHALA